MPWSLGDDEIMNRVAMGFGMDTAEGQEGQSIKKKEKDGICHWLLGVGDDISDWIPLF